MGRAMLASLASDSVLGPMIWGGLATAFLHAALPTHWLPFVLVGRAQGWGAGRTLWVTAAAGGAHIATTATVGGLIAAAGLALDQWVSGVLPYVAAALLFGFGLYYLGRAAARVPALADGPDELAAPTPRGSHRAAALGLIGMMAVSPGEALLPFYLRTASEGVWALAGLTLAFAIGTIAGMLVFTGLARAGVSAFRLERLARYEGAILGLALLALGVFVAINPA